MVHDCPHLLGTGAQLKSHALPSPRAGVPASALSSTTGEGNGAGSLRSRVKVAMRGSMVVMDRLAAAIGATVLAWVLIAVALGGNVFAHPLSQGKVVVLVDNDKHAITLNISVATEELIVEQKIPAGNDDAFTITANACRKHGSYLLSHFSVNVNNRAGVIGAIGKIVEPDETSIHVLDIARTYVTYEIVYSVAEPIRTLVMTQNMLNEMEFSPGNRWEATYIAAIRSDGKMRLENRLLSSTTPLTFSAAETEALPHPTVSTVEPGTRAPVLQEAHAQSFWTLQNLGFTSIVIIGVLFQFLRLKKGMTRRINSQ